MDGVVNSHAFFASGAGRLMVGPPVGKRAAQPVRDAKRAPLHGDHRMMVDMIDPAAVVHLNAVIAATGAKVVLSSSWRIPWPWPAVWNALDARGFDGLVIDATPNGAIVPRELEDADPDTYTRGIEIQAWLDAHPAVESFAIVDDSADMAHLLPRLVRTTWARGLEAEHVAPLVALLIAPVGAEGSET